MVRCARHWSRRRRSWRPSGEPAAVSLREVARRAGVSQAAPYHYFTDKSALLAAVAEEGFRLFDASQAMPLEQAPSDPTSRLGALGVSYVRFALDRPHYFKVMFRPHLIEHAKYPSSERGRRSHVRSSGGDGSSGAAVAWARRLGSDGRGDTRVGGAARPRNAVSRRPHFRRHEPARA